MWLKVEARDIMPLCISRGPHCERLDSFHPFAETPALHVGLFRVTEASALSSLLGVLLLRTVVSGSSAPMDTLVDGEIAGARGSSRPSAWDLGWRPRGL